MRRPSSQPPELPGYTFVKLLGSGGFSDVFLYDQKLPRRRVAVKVLLTDELTAANRAAFVAEANRMAQLSAGLGILQGLVIDQHFEQRGRIGRRLAIVAGSPSLLGVGLDEDTCAIVHADQTIQVIGRGAVTIVDGSHVKTDAYRGKGYRPLMVSGAVLHSLPAGYWFDLRSRKLLAADDALAAEREASE